MNPIETIKLDRAEARKVEDPNADICYLALASADGKASVRTLVLRDIAERSFKLFINSSSPKYELLTNGAHFELLLWYPSQQKQFRIQGETSLLETDEVKSNWFRRPTGSKRLDYVYKEFAPQSSQIDSREVLSNEIKRIKAAYDVDDMVAPDSATGVELLASQIEMLDLNREDKIHDRRVFSYQNGAWQERVLIP